MDLRRGPARLAFRLGLERLGHLLGPRPRIEPLDVDGIVERYRVRPDLGGWISGPCNSGHWPER